MERFRLWGGVFRLESSKWDGLNRSNNWFDVEPAWKSCPEGGHWRKILVQPNLTVWMLTMEKRVYKNKRLAWALWLAEVSRCLCRKTRNYEKPFPLNRDGQIEMEFQWFDPQRSSARTRTYRRIHSRILSCKFTHIHILTHIETQHRDTYAHTYTQSHRCIRAVTDHTCAQSHFHTHTHADKHGHVFTRTHKRSNIRTHSQDCILTHISTCKHTGI